MYVCLCKGVTDKDIEQAAEQGCRSLRELKNNFGLGSQCGRCTGHAREVLDAATQSAARSSVQYVNPVVEVQPPPNFDVEVCYT
ncbi:MAG TPA: bacterioferritin-associated ferredoxin [Aliidiomarina sp.]|nr:bacterioferritin-associated ferredoxin [Aliidiomarina sp.]